ncbi:MopE-related protein [Aestuariivivens sediminis]|uniref:MopE-related protein n=1 Tax=Aestuariivivens sediminis TaxID=2913557 RepID=UPI001F564F67|nr:MopE-related protein [Aestuariivivens sediminis]
MKHIYTFAILFFVALTSSAQDCTSGTKYNENDLVASNSGIVEILDITVGHDAYLEVSGILAEEYQFTASHTNLGTPVNDFITITDAFGAPLKSGTSPINYTFTVGEIPNGIVQLHYFKDASCAIDDINLTATLLNLTASTTTCQTPESPRIDYLSDSRIDFHWSAPSLGATPVGYSWIIVFQGDDPGQVLFSGATDASTLNASSGAVLSPNTDYDIYIYTNCGENGFSDPLGPLDFSTNAGPPPGNDLCDGALLVVQETNTDTDNAALRAGSVVNGAETNFEGENCDGGDTDNARDDVWYAFIAQTTDIHIELLPDFNGILTLFSGDCGTLIDEACSDGNKTLAPRDESIYFSGLVVGETYYFRVYSQGFSASDPNFILKLWSSQSITDGDGDGYSTAGGDCNDGNNTVYPGAPELCDGLDNDCDGVTPSNEIDADNDGFSECEGDCNDTDNTIYPFAPELCDGKDNDCANGIDDGLVFEDYYTDADGDGYGDASDTPESSCEAVSGKVTNNLDCDDTDNTVYSGAPEICDGKDNDCANGIDDGLVFTTYYIDADDDGFGDMNDAGNAYCSNPGPGYSLNNSDCNDANAAIHPAATEICDGLDNDCNGLTDDDDSGVVGQTTYYRDSDDDGFGDATDTVQACSAPVGYVSVSGDCNDANMAINPDATEVCDGIDNDCDGLIDGDDPDVADQTTYYRDSDDDGYGDATDTVQACSAPVGYVVTSGDCDDTEPTVYPGAFELCDGLDNDCVDGIPADEGDSDSDGVLDCNDNCPNTPNPGQEDTDNDGIGDACEGLSVEDMNFNNIRIEPNPFTSVLHVHLPSYFDGKSIGLTLYDLNGRVVYTDSKLSENGVLKIERLSQLQKGIYLLKLYDEGDETMKQVIKR